MYDLSKLRIRLANYEIIRGTEIGSKVSLASVVIGQLLREGRVHLP